MTSKIYSKICLIVFLVTSLISAGETPASVLKKSSDFFNSANSLSLKFKVKVYYEVTEETDEYDGDLLLGKGDEFRLNIPAMSLYSDGVSLWQHNIGPKQVVVKNLLDMDGKLHPSEILFQYLKCTPTKLEKKKIDKKDMYVLTLDTKNKIASLEYLEVWLDPKTYAPIRMKTIDVSKNTFWYDIGSIKRNLDVNSTDFEYKAIDGVELIDMR